MNLRRGTEYGKKMGQKNVFLLNNFFPHLFAPIFLPKVFSYSCLSPSIYLI